jgi:hypothetical protein
MYERRRWPGAHRAAEKTVLQGDTGCARLRRNEPIHDELAVPAVARYHRPGLTIWTTPRFHHDGSDQWKVRWRIGSVSAEERFLLDSIRSAHLFGVLDCEQDAEILWPIYRRELSDGLGIDEEDVTKDKWFVRELGGS